MHIAQLFTISSECSRKVFWSLLVQWLSRGSWVLGMKTCQSGALPMAMIGGRTESLPIQLATILVNMSEGLQFDEWIVMVAEDAGSCSIHLRTDVIIPPREGNRPRRHMLREHVWCRWMSHLPKFHQLSAGWWCLRTQQQDTHKAYNEASRPEFTVEQCLRCIVGFESLLWSSGSPYNGRGSSSCLLHSTHRHPLLARRHIRNDSLYFLDSGIGFSSWQFVPTES